MNPTGYEHPVTAEYYDHAEALFKRDDTGFFVAYALQSQGPVLELGCGTGRILIPTAKAGCPITGIDSSQDMLKICQKKLRSLPKTIQKQVNLVRGDIRSFHLYRSFNLITVPFRAFHHLITMDDQFSCLECVHRHLAADGLFILDLFNPLLQRLLDEKGTASRVEEPEVWLEDGRRISRIQHNYAPNPSAQIVHVHHTYFITESDQNLRRVDVHFPMRYFFRYEIEHLLTGSGFQLLNLYGNYQKAGIDEVTLGEMIFIARKIT